MINEAKKSDVKKMEKAANKIISDMKKLNLMFKKAHDPKTSMPAAYRTLQQWEYLVGQVSGEYGGWFEFVYDDADYITEGKYEVYFDMGSPGLMSKSVVAKDKKEAAKKVASGLSGKFKIKKVVKEDDVKEGTCGYGVDGELGDEPAGPQLLKKKNESVGSKKYNGRDWFWPHDYRHYLRDASPAQRKKIHDAWLKIGIPVKGTGLKISDRYLEPKKNQLKKAWTIVRKVVAPKELGMPIPESVSIVDEACQKGYMTHPTRKTKIMFGKRYRNCVKKEGVDTTMTMKQAGMIADNICVNCGDFTNENLKKWFSDRWVNIGKKKKGGGHPPCGSSGKKRGYAKCVPASKAANMSKKQKASATRRKRAAQNKAGRGGTSSLSGGGKKPIRVSTKPKK